MICPMQNMRRASTNHSCNKKYCAWWNKELEQCCIVTIAENIDNLVRGQRTIYTRRE